MVSSQTSLPSVGFALLSHGDPAQLLRMIEGLNRHYSDPPIAVHHDSYQSPIDTTAFPANVRFTDTVFRTRWGRISVIKASIEAISTLYRNGGPDWFFFASAACYPVMQGDKARQILGDSAVDAFLDIAPARIDDQTSAKLIGVPNPMLTEFRWEAHRRMKWRFMLSPMIWIPILRFKPKLRIGRATWYPEVEGPNPYDGQMKPMFGDFWFAASRKAAEWIVAPHPKREALIRHLKGRPFPDETFYPSWLAANPQLIIDRNNRRWAEWAIEGDHPEPMTRERTDRALASGAFFARKFEPGSDLLDYIDEQLASEGAHR